MYLKEMLQPGSPMAKNRDLQTHFICLQCRYDPSAVYKYLVDRDQDIDYDIDTVLQHCGAAAITDACIFSRMRGGAGK